MSDLRRDHNGNLVQTLDELQRWATADSSGFILVSLEELNAVAAEVERLRTVVEHTADGMPIGLGRLLIAVAASQFYEGPPTPFTGVVQSIELLDNIVYVTLENEIRERCTVSCGECYRSLEAAKAAKEK